VVYLQSFACSCVTTLTGSKQNEVSYNYLKLDGLAFRNPGV